MTLETQAPVSAPVRYDPFGPTTYSRTHILAPAPVAKFDGQTYPSLWLAESAAVLPLGDVRISLTGTPDQRAEFVAQLRAVADTIEAWTEGL